MVSRARKEAADVLRQHPHRRPGQPALLRRALVLGADQEEPVARQQALGEQQRARRRGGQQRQTGGSAEKR